MFTYVSFISVNQFFLQSTLPVFHLLTDVEFPKSLWYFIYFLNIEYQYVYMYVSIFPITASILLAFLPYDLFIVMLLKIVNIYVLNERCFFFHQKKWMLFLNWFGVECVLFIRGSAIGECGADTWSIWLSRASICTKARYSYVIHLRTLWHCLVHVPALFNGWILHSLVKNEIY